jgi:hypothetical protein
MQKAECRMKNIFGLFHLSFHAGHIESIGLCSGIQHRQASRRVDDAKREVQN